MAEFEVIAELRKRSGTSEMRRMRAAGQVPGILYGAGKDPLPISMREQSLRRHLENEAFFSHILAVRVEGMAEEQAVIKDLQRHPATSQVLHLDLMRVSATQELTMTVPLHFENEDTAPGAKLGGVFSHHEADVEISCLPGNLPEYIVVDVGHLELGDSINLSNLTPPQGVELVALSNGNDLILASLAMPRTIEEEEEVEEGLEGEEPAADADAEGDADGEGDREE